MEEKDFIGRAKELLEGLVNLEKRVHTARIINKDRDPRIIALDQELKDLIIDITADCIILSEMGNRIKDAKEEKDLLGLFLIREMCRNLKESFGQNLLKLKEIEETYNIADTCMKAEQM